MKTIIIIIISLTVASCSSVTTRSSKQDSRKTLSGRVVSESGSPAVDAIMFIDGRQTSYKTNSKGIYKMKVKPGTETISVFNYEDGSEERGYYGQDTINFVLTGEYNAQLSVSQAGNEYVNIGYGKVQKDKLTTSVGEVSKQKLNQHHYTDIYSMIQGEVPGVSVTGNRIIIRGIATINSSTDPLFVVDGIKVSSIAHINPLDVESINILKGAATAIYGVNGANGVILIETKKAERKRK